jgi:hypothetical protein
MEISYVTPPGQRGSFIIGSREQGLSLEDLPERHLKLLDEPVTAGMSCVNGNGTIHTSPVWVSRDKTEILLNSVRGRQKTGICGFGATCLCCSWMPIPITGWAFKAWWSRSSTKMIPSTGTWPPSR